MLNYDITLYGDQAILVNFQQVIQEDINVQVYALKESLEIMNPSWVRYFIPAYCSLTIGCDFYKVSTDWALKEIELLLSKLKVTKKQNKQLTKTIPVCYHPSLSIDIEYITHNTKLSIKKIIQLHTQTIYRVYMMGFQPGFPYMGNLAKELQLPRKESPRIRIPARSVAIAGTQSGIYPSASPGGWHIIGRTPLPLLKKETFLLEPGDHVRFEAVDIEEYNAILQSEKLVD